MEPWLAHVAAHCRDVSGGNAKAAEPLNQVKVGWYLEWSQHIVSFFQIDWESRVKVCDDALPLVRQQKDEESEHLRQAATTTKARLLTVSFAQTNGRRLLCRCSQ